MSTAFAQSSNFEKELEELKELVKKNELDSAITRSYKMLERYSASDQRMRVKFRLSDVYRKTNDFELYEELATETKFLLRRKRLDSSTKFFGNRIIFQYYINTLQSDSAIKYGLLTKETASSIEQEVSAMLDLANVYAQKGNIDDQRAIYDSIEENENYELTELEQAIIANGRAGAFYKLGNYDKAIGLFKEAIPLFTAVGDSLWVTQLYHVISICYQQDSNFRKAYQYYYLYDSLQNRQQAAANAELRRELAVKYETEKAKQSAKLNQEKAELNGRVVLILSVSIIIIIPLVLWLITVLRRNKKLYESLETANDQLKDANKNLEDKVLERTKELEEKNTRLKGYAFATSHLLRKPLANILGLSYLITQKEPDNPLFDRLKSSAEELDVEVKGMGELLDD